jgi:hypothetical protein
MPKKYIAIAQQGERYIVAGKNGDKGYIYDNSLDSISNEISVHAILGRGYWSFIDDPSKDVQQKIDEFFNSDNLE